MRGKDISCSSNGKREHMQPEVKNMSVGKGCLLGLALNAVLSLAICPPALAGDVTPPSGDGTLSFQAENDFFGGGTDRHFTHGTRITYLTSPRVPEDADDLIARMGRLVPFFPDNANFRASYSLGQSIFTPEDITQTALIAEDRPYAGWLYAGFGLVAERDDRKTIDNLELDIGAVGPWSFAEQVQRNWHKAFDLRKPRGWANQINNEPGINLLYEHSWKAWEADLPGGTQFDIIPNYGGSLGNVFTYVSSGATVRFGSGLERDFGPPRIRPSLPGSGFYDRSDSLDWYLFAGVGGRAVLRNITLDGNTFSDSHRVDKKLLVGDAQAGAVLRYGRFQLSYTHIFRTREYFSQDRPDRFGSVSLSYAF